MALAITSPLAVPSVRTVPWPRHLTGPIGSVLSLAVCALGAAAVALPALRTPAPLPASGQITVQVLGDISTAGLPATAAVSTLTVHNDGAAPLQWSARPSVEGPGALGVVVEAWVPTAAGCTAPTALLDAATWSAQALQPGDSTPVCVRVRTTGTSAGTATPHLTVAARSV